MREDVVTRDVLVQVPPERAFAAFVDVSDVLAWLADLKGWLEEGRKLPGR